MAKGKKKNKKSTFYKAIKPFISDKRVLLSIVGAAGVGVALASALGTDKGKEIVDKIAGAVKDFTQNRPVASKNSTPAKQPA